eukprot:10843598-Lingulodinium_polyedra.AAC.1
MHGLHRDLARHAHQRQDSGTPPARLSAVRWRSNASPTLGMGPAGKGPQNAGAQFRLLDADD